MTHMYDSAAGHFPARPACVALYANGDFQYRGGPFPTGTRVLWIDVNGTDYERASILDIETGDATPDHVAGWCRARLAAVPDSELRLYCNRDTWPAVIRAVRTLPAPARAVVRYWIADPTGHDHTISGASAVQWSWGPDGGWDVSTIGADW